MGLFDKQSEISRQDLRSSFKKDSGRIPDTGGKRYDPRQRDKMAKELFTESFGSSIDRNEYRRIMMNLESKMNATKSKDEKATIKEEIKYLKSVGGWKIR